MPKYQFQIIDSTKGLQEIRDQWESLYRKTECTIPYLHPNWLLSWWDYFGKGKAIWVILGYSGDRLVAFLPLTIVRLPLLRGGGQRLEAMGLPFADYTGLLAEHPAEEALWEGIHAFLMNVRDQWDIAYLPRLLTPIPGSSVSRTERFWVQLETDWEAHLRTLKRKMRDELKRLENRLSKHGHVRFDDITSDASKHIDKLIEMHKTRWSVTPFPSQFNNPKIDEFYKDWSSDQNGPGKLHALYLNDKIIAYHLGFGIRDAFYYYCPTFDLEYADFSPGKLLLFYLIRDACENGYRFFDLGYDRMSYKDWFANGHTFLHEYVSYSGSLRSYIYIAQKRVSEFPVVQKWIKHPIIQTRLFGRAVK